MGSGKYYVVWRGYAPGIYDSWEEAEIQVSGYPDASFRSYKTLEAATEAFREGFDKDGLLKEVAREVEKARTEGHIIEFNPDKKNSILQANSQNILQNATTTSSIKTPSLTPVTTPQHASSATTPYIQEAIAVDAACSGNPGPMEYRGVYVKNGRELFRIGPLEGGTNNIGEFLAIVHGLALQAQKGTRLPIYSDSVNAQAWIRQGVCKTQLKENAQNARIFEMIRRAESWLRTHTIDVPIIKWDTKSWGEIPADFGRK